MKQQLYREVSKGVGTTFERVPDFEVEAAIQEYIKTGKCKHEYIYDTPGFMYDQRVCGICGKYLDLI